MQAVPLSFDFRSQEQNPGKRPMNNHQTLNQAKKTLSIDWAFFRAMVHLGFSSSALKKLISAYNF